jgi:hypothetical protein
MERIQLLNKFYRPSGSTIYKYRVWVVTIPKLTGMALEDAALELNRLGLDIGIAIVPDHDNFRGGAAGHTSHNHLPESISGNYRAHGVPGGYLRRIHLAVIKSRVQEKHK